MTLLRKLTLRYAAIVGVCLLLLGGLARHEFIAEPAQRQAMGIPELPESWWGEYAEVFFYGMIPLVLGCGWWFLRKTLAPIDRLADSVERVHADNLHEPLPRSGTGDEVDRLTASFNDLTRRLDQAFRQIREFTLHASHELKTPLTVMRAELGAALRDAELQSTPAQCEQLHSLLDEVQRLARMVDGLTLLTKADSGLVPLERQPVPLGQLVRECFDDAIILAAARNIRVTLDACEELTVLGDRDRLRQLFLNLTDNAVKYNHPAGSISMSLASQGDLAWFKITNTGAGIPPELLPRVFDRFVRGPGKRHQPVEGCGLGLTICRWIVQSHGGGIQAGSEADKTTTFTVRLPLATA
jgi:signal transduction histidine kinase